MRLEPRTTTLAEYFSDVRALIEDGLESNTVAGYDRAWRIRIAPTLGDVVISELRTVTVMHAMRQWDGKSSTRNAAKVLLSRVLDLAVLDELLPTNPCKALPRRRGKATERDLTERALTRAQVATMLEVTAWHPYGQRILAAMVLTGTRLGEAAALRAEHVDLENGLLRIRATLSPDGRGRVRERATKSGLARDVPIIDEFKPWLESAMSTGFPYLFTGSKGGPFDSTNLSRALRWSKTRAAIGTFPDGSAVRFHDLRHTFATYLSELGLPPTQIQRVMGHASITTTERYLHNRSRDAALAAKRLLDAQTSEVTFRGGESAANTGANAENPRKSGGFTL